MLSSTTGVQAEVMEKHMEALERNLNSPPGFNYQAVLRNSDGSAMVSSSVTLRFTVSNSAGNQWIETHAVTTDANGMVTAVIGDGTKTGGSATSFDLIDWGASDASLKVEVNSGSGFVDLGTNVLQSVPYAAYADNGLTQEERDLLTTIPAEIDDLADGSGNATLSGVFTANELAVSGAFSLPTAAGTDGQVLTTDGAGGSSWADAAGGSYAGAGSNSFVAGYQNSAVSNYSAISGGYSNSIERSESAGSTISGGQYNTITARGFYGKYYGGNSAIAGGQNNTIEAIEGFIGGGNGNVVSGDNAATVGGKGLIASSYASTVVGKWNDSSAPNTLFVVGKGSEGSRSNALVVETSGNTDIDGAFTANSLGVDGAFTLPTTDGTSGQVLQTDGSGNVSWGTGGAYGGAGQNSFKANHTGNLADGNYSFAAGFNAKAYGDFSVIGGGSANWTFGKASAVVGGAFNRSIADYSSVLGGKESYSMGNYSIAGGRKVETSAYAATALGFWNSTRGGTNNSVVSTDALLVVGNGTSTVRADALLLQKNGNMTIAGTLTQNSDRRLKTDIVDLGSTLEDVAKMRGVKYKWNDVTLRDTKTTQIGLIAQEVEQLFPELVKEGSNGYKSVDYINLIPVLIEAIKELNAQNQSLMAENDQLERANDDLEVRQSKDEARFADLESKLNKLMMLVALVDMASND